MRGVPQQQSGRRQQQRQQHARMSSNRTGISHHQATVSLSVRPDCCVLHPGQFVGRRVTRQQQWQSSQRFFTHTHTRIYTHTHAAEQLESKQHSLCMCACAHTLCGVLAVCCFLPLSFTTPPDRHPTTTATTQRHQQPFLPTSKPQTNNTNQQPTTGQHQARPRRLQR